MRDFSNKGSQVDWNLPGQVESQENTVYVLP